MNNNQNLWLESEEESFDLRNFIFKYLRIWPWFIVSVVLCGIMAWLYLRYSTPIFNVSATLLVKDEQKGMKGGAEIMEELGLSGASKLVENEIEVLRSRNLMAKVVDELKCCRF